MIKDFSFVPMWEVPILRCTVDLPHRKIEEYLREQFAEWGQGYTSYHDVEFNEHLQKYLPARTEMETAMVTASKTFINNRGGYGTKDILQYWFSIYNTGDDHNTHTHPGAVVAGTYYPHADEDSTKIRYHNPHRVAMMHGEPRIDPKYAMHDHHATTGEMNLWPAWLEHEVRPQKPVDPDKARIAISFNYGRA